MYSIIMNPSSGHGAALKRLADIETLLKSRNIEYRVDATEKKGDATSLARKAIADGMAGVIVLGGDGTFSEVVNGIGESGIEIIFAPCGTGNDFMRMFKLPKKTVEAVQLQLDSPVRMIDIGKYNDRYFLNVTGCGFDVDVLMIVDKHKDKYSSLGAYMRGAYSAIKNYKPMNSLVSIDENKPIPMITTVISVGNGGYIGGGMKALPGAAVDDGYFNLMLIEKVNKISIYVLLILFSLGLHPWLRKLVTTVKCRSVRIQSKDMHLEADGEVFACDDITLTLIPSVLRTRLPK